MLIDEIQQTFYQFMTLNIFNVKMYFIYVVSDLKMKALVMAMWSNLATEKDKLELSCQKWTEFWKMCPNIVYKKLYK